MIHKGALVLLLLAVAIHKIQGQGTGSCDISDSFLDNAWYYSYEDGVDYNVLNIRFTNETVVMYRENTRLETFDCVATDGVSPALVFLLDSQTDGSRKCFQFYSFNPATGHLVVFGFRETDGTGALTGSDCLTRFEPGGAANTENLSIMVLWDPDNLNVNDGFDFALNNGACAGTFPVAYDRGVSADSPEILKTKELAATVDIGDSLGYQCEGVPSTCTRKDNKVDCNMCNIGKARSYYYPLDEEWFCLGNLASYSVGGLTGPHFQIFAIKDVTNRWHFACARYEVIQDPTLAPGDPRCIQFSMDLTDDVAPVCRIKNDDNSDVLTSQANRDGEKGYISVRLCAEDCKNARCENNQPDECVQSGESFVCGNCTTNYEGYLCETEQLECASNPCENGGVCRELADRRGFECDCSKGLKGYSGVRCEIRTCIIDDLWKGANYFYRYDGSVDTAQVQNIVFVDDKIITIEGVDWECERELEETTGIYAYTLKKAGTEERQCLQVVPLAPTVSNQRSFLFTKLINQGITTNAVDPRTCNFASVVSFNVLIHPNAVYATEVPFAHGTYQVESYFDPDDCGIGEDASQASIQANSNNINLAASCNPSANNLLPNGQSTVSVVVSWDPSVWGDNIEENGQGFLVAIDNLLAGDNGPTYYCGRYRQDGADNPIIDISFNINSQLAPECQFAANSEKSDQNHVHLRLTSNRCYILTNPCKFGTCTDTPNQQYACDCDPGYFFSNGECQEINECAAEPCDPDGVETCTDKINSFECTCNPGWSGTLCEIEDKCYNNLCQNGECVLDNSFSSGYRCDCEAGWEDDYCDKDIDECKSNPCQNEGNCTQVTLQNQLQLDFYRCICKAGYSGIHCENVQDNCNPNRCQNDGTCVNYPDRNDPGYICICKLEWRYAQCQHRNECFVAPFCHPENTVKCLDLLDEKICYCKEGFLGGSTPDGHHNGDCSQPDTSNPCYSSPCENHGVCHQDGDEFTCQCALEFTGETCTEKQITCADNPCKVRETCTSNATMAYLCTCPDGVTCEDEGFGILEGILVGMLVLLVFACIILGIWAVCSNRCGTCCTKGGCCP